MKNLSFPSRAGKIACSFLLLSGLALIGPEPSAAPSEQAVESTSSGSAVTQPKLPYGVDEVLKLTRARISDDVVVNYIDNSGTIYSLSSSDIVYLRQEGVTDRVINAMLDQRKKLADASQSQAAAVQAPTAPTTAPAAPQDPAATANPAPVYVQAPAQPAPSTVYVIPYAATSPYYYPPYYGYYGPYWGPSISVGIGFGGYWHGGYHGWGGNYYGHYGHGHWGGGHYGHH